MKRWTTIKQDVEMAYSQPAYSVKLNAAEVELVNSDASNMLAIATRTIKTTMQVDDEEPSVSERIDQNMLYTYDVMVPDRWAKNLNLLTPINTSAGKGLLLSQYTYLPKLKRGTKIKDRFKIAMVRVGCLRDVADAANYFGDRLPPEFYEQYSMILIDNRTKCVYCDRDLDTDELPTHMCTSDDCLRHDNMDTPIAA